MGASFKEYYESNIVPELVKQFGYESHMAVPKILKINLNMGLGDAVGDKKILQKAVDELTLIATQKALPTLARKSEAGFKIREGWPIGCKVTLRKDRMYDFLERLVKVAMPRIRDFRGLKVNSFDGRGNYSMGIKEQIIFPEIDYDKIDRIRGLDITVVTSAKTDAEAMALLSGFHFPFIKRKKPEIAQILIEEE